MMTRLHRLLCGERTEWGRRGRGTGRRLLHLFTGQLVAQVEMGSCATDLGSKRDKVGGLGQSSR